MKINDASNPEESLYHDALDMVDADSTTWTFAKFVRSANFALDALVRKILTVNGRWKFADSNDTVTGTYKTNLVSGQGDYTIADSMLTIVRLRILDAQGEWKTLDPLDRRDLTDDDLNETGEPTGYDKNGRSLVLVPTPDYSATLGIELTVQTGSNHFAVTDTTKTPGVESIFHRYISLFAARDYAQKYNKDRVSIIDVDMQRMEKDIEEFYATRDQDEAPFLSVEKSTEIY